MRTKIIFALVMLLAGIMIAVPAFHDGMAGGSGTLRIVTEEEFAQGRDRGEPAAFSASSLRWREGLPACDEGSSIVYIPCGEKEAEDIEELLSGLKPVGKGTEILLAPDEKLRMPLQAVKEGHVFRAILINSGRVSEFGIVLTGLPVLCMQKTDDSEIVRKEDHSGQIRLLAPLETIAGKDPAPSEADSGVLRCVFHVRGNVSSLLEKKPYKISLKNDRGEKKKVSLLGMRTDDDWILNPLFTDSSRIREMTAYALWDKISALADVPQKSSRMQYVELVLDNSYQGIYALSEPVDGKQTGLGEGDLLYKIDRWDREYPYLDLYDESAGKTEILNGHGLPCVEITYPRQWDRTASWDPMKAYHEFSFRTQDPETLRQAGLEIDMDSVVTLSLYCAMTHAMDNNWKNSLLIAKKTGEGKYRLYRTIWDLNYVFGDVFVYKPEEGYTAFSAASAMKWKPFEDTTYDYEAFASADPSAAELTAQKWKQWRKGGIDADMVCLLAKEYETKLRDSGAIARENARWPLQTTFDDSLERMETWIRRRFQYLDGYFGL